MNESLLYIAAGAAVAGLVQGLSGFAFGLVAMTFWSWNVEPQLAGPMVVFGSFIGQLLSLKTIRRGFRRDLITPLLIGGILGVPVGVFLLHYLNAEYFKLCIGCLLIVYCPIMIFSKNVPKIGVVPAWVEVAVGHLSGILGGIGGLTGPVITLWCTARSWNSDTQRSVFQTFNLAMHTLTLMTYIASGLIDARALQMFSIVAPAMLIPTIIGNRLYSYIDQSVFRLLILTILSLSGAAILVSLASSSFFRH